MVQLHPRHVRDSPQKNRHQPGVMNQGEEKKTPKELLWTPLLSSIKKDPEKTLTTAIHVHIVSNIKFLSFDL